jgi:hypothetical protein
MLPIIYRCAYDVSLGRWAQGFQEERKSRQQHTCSLRDMVHKTRMSMITTKSSEQITTICCGESKQHMHCWDLGPLTRQPKQTGELN